MITKINDIINFSLSLAIKLKDAIYLQNTLKVNDFCYILYNKLLTSKYIFLNKLRILIYKLTIISEKFVAQNINYKVCGISIYMEKEKININLERTLKLSRRI